MKKFLWISNIFFIATTLILAYILLFTGTDLVKTDDGRTKVKYPPDLRKFVMSEMRDYLEIIHEIHQGITENNPEKIAKAAHRQGNAFLDDTPARLLKLSPIPCKTMGFKGHDLYQAIEDSARMNYKPETTMRQLAELTQNCVVCHRTYKVYD